MDREFGQKAAEIAFLCATMAGSQLEKTPTARGTSNGWELGLGRDSFTYVSDTWAGWLTGWVPMELPTRGPTSSFLTGLGLLTACIPEGVR